MPAPLRVVVGSDGAGASYKQAIKADLERDPRVLQVVDVSDLAPSTDESSYPDVAIAAAQAVASGLADRAVLVCGTGIGMAIAANKVPGIRATVAHDSFSVERSILSNDCQILTLGERVVGLQLARRLVSEWLDYEFDPSSPSDAKVSVIRDYEGNLVGHPAG
jgi:ribose 5-phosphate isomerase B